MPIFTCDHVKCDPARNGYGPCRASVETHSGSVLATFERNGSDDSDFLAIVWDAETAKVATVEYASTRGWTYHNRAVVDATPDVIDAAKVWATARWQGALIARAESERLSPVKGRTVESTTTRGKNVGVSGVVMWHGVDSYKTTRFVTAYRVGVKVEGEPKLRYLSADSVRVIDAEPIDTDGIAAMAASFAETRSIRSALECWSLAL